jgi:glyoxylase-like metal-dependent hydrolase (beta-lactamase superfamily II)
MVHPLIRVGSIEVVPLCDGWAALPLAAELPGHAVDWAAERAAHPWSFADGDAGSWAWHVHAFLLRRSGGAILVDSGIGHHGSPPYDVTGRIDDELRSVGVAPGDVRHVIHTHLHSDHAGGACRPDGEPRFPNAIHHVHPADWDFFAHDDGSGESEARSAMRGLQELGMLDLDPADREIASGVRVVHSPGHTPGHRSVILTEGDASLLLTGDLLHLPVQAAHPEWRSGHDEDPALGVTSRTALLARARDADWQVAVSHFGHPFGRVVTLGDGQRWDPA